jgi:hypothetical protein
MVFDPVLFGYGVGFVMTGWVVGACVSVVLSLFKRAGRII